MYKEITNQMHKKKETQQDLANLLEVDKSQVCRKILGQVEWHMSEILTLCKHYNMKFEKLFRKEC